MKTTKAAAKLATEGLYIARADAPGWYARQFDDSCELVTLWVTDKRADAK